MLKGVWDMHKIKLLFIMLLLFPLCVPANATILTLQPDGASGIDAQIADGVYSSNNFADDGNLIINWIDNNRSIGLIQYDLSQIPDGSSVDSAILDLYHTNNISNGTTYDIFRITSAWDENSVTFNTSPSIDPIAVSSLTIFDNDTFVHRTWDITTLVDDWVNGTYMNYGMWIEEIPISGDGVAYFASSDWNVGYSAGEERPKLTVDYQPVPEPSTFILFGAGLAGLVAWRRKWS